MTLLRERGRSDDNDARAFLLSNAAEERAELLGIISYRLEFCPQRSRPRKVSQPLT